MVAVSVEEAKSTKADLMFWTSGLRLLFQSHQRISRLRIDPDQLVEFELQRLSISVLRILDDENHQKRDDCCTRY